jgi:ADP-ribosyl-[dinitrogen reductase] hydrolase
MENKMMRDKYTGSFVGGGLGDTLGMPIETWSRERIKKYLGKVTAPMDSITIKDSDGKELAEDEFGKIKYYARGLTKGDWTDDTILSHALGKSLVEYGLNLRKIAKDQLREYTSRVNPDGTYTGGFGGTTIEGFKNLLQGKSPLESGIIGGPGNAPSMKMAPLGLYAHANRNLSECLDFAEKIGRITHLDPRSVVSGVIQTGAVYNLVDGIEREDFLDYIVGLCEKYEKPLDESFKWSKMGNMLSRLEWIRKNKDISDEEAYEKIGVTSAVYKSYPFALFMFQKYWDKPLEGLIETVNYGGDCDTTGAMYGALAGAKNGIDIFPKEWVDILKDKDELINLGNVMYCAGGKK